MRTVVLDTETTGLDPVEDRIIEIGAIEMIDLRPTGRVLHHYVNPQRSVHPDATRIHGLTYDMLKRKPTFKRVAPLILEFLEGAEFVAHNASFDLSFLNAELARLEIEPLANPVVDTLALAREVKKGGKHSLDVLCRHFGIDVSKRTLHGALLDAQLLAEVYVELRGGKQITLSLPETDAEEITPVIDISSIPVFTQPLLTETEAAAHRAFVDGGKLSIWASYLKEEQHAYKEAAA